MLVSRSCYKPIAAPVNRHLLARSSVSIIMPAMKQVGASWEREPRWPAVVALLASGGLYMALPPSLVAGPRWALLVIILALVIPTVLTHRSGKRSLNHVLGLTVTGIVTVAMICSLVLLVAALPSHREAPPELLRSAMALWITNVLVFALWYWRLDAGGPNQRDLNESHTNGAFLFPQMTQEKACGPSSDESRWSPNFFDYLFIAFNTSTALSPTDAPVLARWAKLLMMLQATISLAVIVLLAARAVNIL